MSLKGRMHDLLKLNIYNVNFCHWSGSHIKNVCTKQFKTGDL